MKKLTLALSILLLLTLTACASAAMNPANPASGSQNGPAAGELPVTTQLILGTFKLEETENAVTTEQAAELLPLWQTMLVLSESDTAAQQETDALVAQIQESMTTEQMQAITGMALTRADMMTVMQEQGLGMGGGQNNSTQNGGSTSNGGGAVPGGAMPAPDERGSFPGGGPNVGGGGPGQNLSADQIATAQAARQAGGGTMIPAPLIDALIEFLKQKTGS